MERSRNGVLHRIQRVMRAFLPEEQDFFVLFSSAADKAVEAAECLDKLMNNYGRLALAVEQIDDIEDEADEIVHETVQKLNTTFVTPALFDREDIYRLAECLDDIPDMIKGTIDRFSSFRIAGPDEATQGKHLRVASHPAGRHSLLPPDKHFGKSRRCCSEEGIG